MLSCISAGSEALFIRRCGIPNKCSVVSIQTVPQHRLQNYKTVESLPLFRAKVRFIQRRRRCYLAHCWHHEFLTCYGIEIFLPLFRRALSIFTVPYDALYKCRHSQYLNISTNFSSNKLLLSEFNAGFGWNADSHFIFLLLQYIKVKQWKINTF